MSKDTLVPTGRKQMSKKERNEALSTPEGREISRTVMTEIMTEFNQPKVMSDNQLRQRLNAYLTRCVKTGQYPTVEEGLLSTGYSKNMMLAIARGKTRGKYFSPEAAEIINKFLDIVAAFDAKMVMEGKLPQIPYIYRSKNFYGMSDKTEVVVGVKEPEQAVDMETLAKRYAVGTTLEESQD